MAEEQKPLPSVEYSLKYVSWHLKDINDSMKMQVAIMKSIDESLKKLVDVKKVMPNLEATPF
jgi:hypothetical protein